MEFRTKLDYSNNRQIRQTQKTITELSGGTVFGLPFNMLISGPNPAISGISQTYTDVISTFSGNSGTTVFTFGNGVMNLGAVRLSAITPSNSATTQSTGLVFTGNSSTIIDSNLVYLSYSGVSFDFIVSAMTQISVNNYSGTAITLQLDVLSADTLDYISRLIWVDVSGITRTNDLIVSRNPVQGYVLTSDAVGNATWQSVSAVTSGTTFWSAGTGVYSTVLENSNSRSSGKLSVSIGSGNTASGNYSFAEGVGNIASGNASHVEGGLDVGNSILSNTASTYSSHAEGIGTKANGEYAPHSEGYQTLASGDTSHAEGYLTIAGGVQSHAEGQETQALGTNSHAEGLQTLSSGLASHAEGYLTQSTNTATHAEGQQTVASGVSSHAEGAVTNAFGENSHAEGSQTTASGNQSHSEGQQTTANGNNSHAEGYLNTSNGFASHVQGSGNTATGIISHVGGANNSSSAFASAIIAGNGNVLTSGAINSSILAGINITGSTPNTAYATNIAANNSISGGTFYSGSTKLENIYLQKNGYLLQKAGSVSGTTFTGNPQIAAIIFTTQFTNNNYSVTVTGEVNRTWTVESKTASGFTINSNAATALGLFNIFWMACEIGEGYK